MQIRSRIYVPTSTPKQKRDRIRWHGGEFVELISVGDTYDAAAAAAQADVLETGATWIHAFDDNRTAAGQGTIGKEIVEQLEPCRTWSSCRWVVVVRSPVSPRICGR